MSVMSPRAVKIFWSHIDDYLWETLLFSSVGDWQFGLLM